MIFCPTVTDAYKKNSFLIYLSSENTKLKKNIKRCDKCFKRIGIQKIYFYKEVLKTKNI